MVVGLKADLKKGALTTSLLRTWQTQMPDLPLYQQRLFNVSSIDSKQSVEELFNSVSLVCSEIFEKHAVLIPSSFRKLLKSIKSIKSMSDSNIPLHHSTEPISTQLPPNPAENSNFVIIDSMQLHKQLKGEIDMDIHSFKYALRYFHAIGQVVFLQNGKVCTNPAVIPKLLAKFISPAEVEMKLLSHYSEVQILSEQQIGFILQINGSNDTRLFSHIM